MRSIKADTTHIVTHEEAKEEVVEKRNFWDEYWKAMAIILLDVAIVLYVMYWSAKRK